MKVALQALDRAVELLGAADVEALPVRDRLVALEGLETESRRIRACFGRVAASVQRCGDAAVGGACARVIADVVRISPAESRRRLRDAASVGPRTTLGGEVLPAALPATATAWDCGLLDVELLRVIEKFHRDIPEDLHPATVAKAEAFLAEKATELRPDQLGKVADRLAVTLNPDGTFSDEYRAAQRGFSWGRQRLDGMTVGTLVATPELRAVLDAWLAKFAAPGMCNPEDLTPTVAGEQAPAVVEADRRQHGQRQHDAIAALVRGQLGDPSLGQHKGLPVTVVVSTTLDQLHCGAGYAVTGGDSLLPMRDVIRMAAHSWHYLCVFDDHSQRPLYLGRSKRIASADQRIVLHAKERGCSAPGCDVPGYWCQVHHVDDWAAGGHTDIDELAFACHQDHPRVGPGGWTTRKRPDGRTEWIPPPEIPLPSAHNDFHHPERHLTKLKVKPRVGEEVETLDVRRRAGRCASSGGAGRGIC